MILLTGNTGFIGQNLVSFLKNNGYRFLHFLGRKTIPNWQTIQSIGNTESIIHLSGLAHDLEEKYVEEDYIYANYTLTKQLYDLFLTSTTAKIFIFISTVAVRDKHEGVFVEDDEVNPVSFYGKSKRMAEEYILSNIPKNKKVYILRPCMVHGVSNKGNLNLLFSFVKIGIPYPLGIFNNERSFLSIDNFCFIIKEFLENKHISSGIYHLADSESVSVKNLIQLINRELGKKVLILNIPKFIIKIVAKFGDFLPLPINTKRLEKLTENYLVSNQKLLKVIDKKLPLTSEEGLLLTIKSLNNAK